MHLYMHLLDVVGCQGIYSFHLERIDSFLLSSRDMHGQARFLTVKSSLLPGDISCKTFPASLPRRKLELGVDLVLPYGGVCAADAVHR